MTPDEEGLPSKTSSDDAIGSLPGDEASLGKESKGVFQSRYQQVLCCWDDFVFHRESVSEELKQEKCLEAFEQAVEQVKIISESTERAVSHSQGLIDHIKLMVCRKVVPDDPIYRDHLHSTFKSFEAKHKYYIPAVNQGLGMLKNGIESSITRNMNIIPRYWSISLKWDQLDEGFERVDMEFDNIEKLLDILDKSRTPYSPSYNSRSEILRPMHSSDQACMRHIAIYVIAILAIFSVAMAGPPLLPNGYYRIYKGAVRPASSHRFFTARPDNRTGSVRLEPRSTSRLQEWRLRNHGNGQISLEVRGKKKYLSEGRAGALPGAFVGVTEKRQRWNITRIAGGQYTRYVLAFPRQVFNKTLLVSESTDSPVPKYVAFQNEGHNTTQAWKFVRIH
ncbi:hypothetical protein BGX27_001278 [Mortierella sp. AM989]|nr:hypothetical protein BGX27_001278 [Mortierella sp. AM989]